MNRFDDLLARMTTVSDDYVSLSTPKQVGAWWNYRFNDDAYLTVGPDGSGTSIAREPTMRRGTGNFVGSSPARSLRVRSGVQPGRRWVRSLTTMAVRTDRSIPLSRVGTTLPVPGVRPWRNRWWLKSGRGD